MTTARPAVIRSFNAADGLGDLETDDGHRLRFGLSALRDQRQLHPVAGLRVLVIASDATRGRATHIEPDWSRLAALPTSFEEARPRIRPHFVTKSTTGALSTKVAPGLAWVPAYDGGYFTTELTAETAAGWSVEAVAVIEAAESTSRSRSLTAPRGPGAGPFVVDTADGTALLHLIAPEAIRACAVRGLPIVFPAHRDHLVIAGTDDLDALGIAILLTEAILLGEVSGPAHRGQARFIGGRPGEIPSDEDTLCGDALVWSQGAWRPFVVDASHPLADRLRALRELASACAYQTQKVALDLAFAASGEEVFVASVQRIEGRLLTVWTEGALTLLPEAPVVAFVSEEVLRHETPHVEASWAAVRDVLAARLQPTGYDPPRWRVESFPTPEELQRLGAASAHD